MYQYKAYTLDKEVVQGTIDASSERRSRGTAARRRLPSGPNINQNAARVFS